ncbi:NCS2 family permease [Paludibacter sp. 221]|uniref:NCS2 family permease n=1 Tax=Paludibacter sp. 221 TaxID=2302939 RepID=UPI0013D3928C|nr:NCS2 family permease [Paludibacter sp. 221]NDV47513.1 NCS2 family permease [Paludibacter sp. 221]
MLEKLFGFKKGTNSVRIEILAGITTFLTMAYILAVNPSILSATGMDKGALFTSTVLAAVLGTILMALLAKLPFALAPGMGLNAFFAYTVCLTMGYSWQFALTAVLIEGVIFIILTLTNLREAIVNLLPDSMKKAISAGIGLFIAFIGLQNAGIIVNNDATLISLGDITSGTALLGLIGILVTSALLILKVKGALLIGILATTIIGIPLGITHYNGVFSVPPSIEPIFFKFEFHNIFTKDMALIVFTFLFVDMFDTIGTLVGVSTKAGMLKDGKIPNAKMAFLSDAIGTTAGAALGTSTVTTYVESAAGVGEGGRTGLTAFVTAICFALALFFSPIFLSIPGAATAPALVLVGLMMLTPIKEIDLNDYSEAIPAFLCIIFMPLAYSISDGIVIGMISYVIINLLSGKYKKISVGMYILAALFALKYFI